MAFIPRIEPDVRTPDSLPQARLETRMGSEVRNAYARLGDQVIDLAQTVAGQVVARAESVEFMNAQRQLSDWQAKQHDPNNPKAVSSYKGRDALNVSQDMLGAFDSEYARIEQSLRPSVRDRFRQHAFVERESMQKQLNTYALGQVEAANLADEQAFMVNRIDEMQRAELAGDQERSQQLWDSTLDTLAAAATARGQGAEVLQQRLATFRSKVREGVLDVLINRDPVLAERYFDANRGDLDAAALQSVEAKLAVTLQDARADEWVQGRLSGGAVVTDPGAIRATYRGLAGEFPGTKISSLVRSPAHNREVGGVANSQHLTGTAGDFVVPKEQRPAFQARAKALGFEAIDEGDHIHLELPPGRRGLTAANGTRAELLADAGQIPDRRFRAAVRSRIDSHFDAIEAEQKAAIRETEAAIYDKIAAADPRLPLRAVVSPQELAFAARSDSLMESINRYRKAMMSGPVVDDDPETLDTLYRLQATDPRTFAGVTLAAYGDRLTGKTMKALAEDQARMRNGKASPQFATEEQLLDLEFGKLGIADDPDTKDANENAVARGQFRQAWLLVKENFIAQTGKAPNDQQTRDMLRNITRGQAGQRLYERMATLNREIPERHRAAIVTQYRQRFGTNPTELDIQQLYWEARRGQ